MSAMTSSHDPAIPDELLPALHEEIARLPEKIRLAVVLCDLQGISQEQAAESLRLSERTLRRRLADGRERLKARLDRRGLAWGEAVMTAVRLREAETVIPPAWREATIRAALDLLNPTAAAGAVSAAAQSLTDEVLKTDVRTEAGHGFGGPAGRRVDGVGGGGRVDHAGRSSPRRRRRPPSTSGPLPSPGPMRKPISSMKPGPCRSAAACSTPTAGRSPGPRSTSGGITRKTVGTSPIRSRTASGAAWR